VHQHRDIHTVEQITGSNKELTSSSVLIFVTTYTSPYEHPTEGAPSILGLKTLDTIAMQGAELWGSAQTGRADEGNSSGTNAADLAALCAPVGAAMVAL